MKEKALFLLLIIGIAAFLLCACGGGETELESESESFPQEKVCEPDLSQIRSICELATLECYYHNVAKSVKSKGTGIAHVGERERAFWIEYTGVATIGIDMSKVTMKVEGTLVTVTIPKAKLIGCKVDTIQKEDYISSEDSWFNKNPITAEEQTSAVAQAQEDMESDVKNNSALLVRAQDRAKKLIENYIVRLGNAAGVEYTVVWEYVDGT